MATVQALGYVRVSTIEQEQGYGRDVQIDRVKAYAASKGLPEPQIYQESKSGEKLFTREELHQMLARAEVCAEQGIETHIIIPGLDRLTRDLIDQEGVVLRCFDRGIRLHSTFESENDVLDPRYAGDPMRTAIRQFFGIIHQLDKAIIQRRLDGGLAKKASEGGFTGGRTPIGYKSVNNELMIDEATAPIIRQIFALHKQGVDQETIAGIISGTFSGNFTRRRICSIISREDLYLKGYYRPRLAQEYTVRPDLIIGAGEEIIVEDIDWDAMPQTVRLPAVALMAQVPYTKAEAEAINAGIMVKWRKRAAYISKQDARKLVDALRA